MGWLWVFLTAIAGALAGATLLHDPGYVLVRAGDLVFESSIAAAVLTLLAVVVATYFLAFVVRRVLQSLGLFGKWRDAWQQNKSIGGCVALYWPPPLETGAPQLKLWTVFRLNPIASLIGR